MSVVESGESDLLLPPNPETAPRDRLKLVYGVFYLLGIGTLLPWNFFSNAKLYYMYKLRNTSIPLHGPYHFDEKDATELQTTFESYLSVAAMVPGVLFMFLNTVATKLIKLKYRMVGAALVMIVMFGVTIALAKIDTDSWQHQFFSLTLVSIIIMNAGSAVLQGGIFGLSSMFPTTYTQAVMGGMGLGGTLAAVASIVALACAPDVLENGFGFFLTAEVVIIFALVGYMCMPLLKFARYHTKQGRRTTLNSKSTEPSIGNGTAPTEVRAKTDIPLIPVFKVIKMYGLTVFLIFFTTLSSYPSLNSSIASVNRGHGPWADKYFMPVSCFLIFNVGDLLGRTVAGWFSWPREGSYWLPILATLRVGFLPLFMLCNVQPRPHNFPMIFHHDAFPIVFMIIFALSNGYLGTLCMMYGPTRVSMDDIETAGAMMSFFLSAGLGFGSLFSFVLIKII